MECMGIVRCSNSSWASPLHMIPKKDGGWRPCGDFRYLNDVTTPDRYPVPHNQDFSVYLAGVVCEQWVGTAWQPLAFFSGNLRDSELLALYLAIQYVIFIFCWRVGSSLPM